MITKAKIFKGLVLAVLFALAEVATLVGAGGVNSALAQVRDDRYPFLERRQRAWPNPQFEPFGIFPGFGDPSRYDRWRTQPGGPPTDYSKAPAAKKTDTQPTTTIMVLGDSIADWLGYGLEEAYGDNPEIGVVRKIRNPSGLIRTDNRPDDWVQMARQMIGSERADYVVVILGLADRQPIRDRASARATGRSAQPGGQLGSETQGPAEQTPAAGQDSAGAATAHEFRSEKWVELYSRRIDDMIAALRSSVAPVLWVGLPAVRGARSKGEVMFLNELYRGRAEKAGITYVDIWDGFVDEEGNFANYGPDYEGQMRRLRTSDGVHFTKAGALKLAHYVRREVERLMSGRAAPMAMPTPDLQSPLVPGEPAARPAAGPIVPLTPAKSAAEDLAGGGQPRPAGTDPVAARVLVRGEALQPPTGRADDFAWPRDDAQAEANEILPVLAAPPLAIVRSPAPAQKGANGTDGRAQRRVAPAAAATQQRPRQ